MATKEDILEQIVEEYLTHKGYFVQHNVRFRPRYDHPDYIRNQDSNHSDIDVLGYNPNLTGPSRVMAVSCKSWQDGFRPKREIDAIENDKVLSGRARWKSFRELCVPKWSEAFQDIVFEKTGTREFTYVTAVAHVVGDVMLWEKYEPFRLILNGNPIKVVAFETMVAEIQENLGTTLASTEVGRLLQMFRAANIGT